MLTEWARNPITKGLINKIQVLLMANEEELTGRVIHGPSLAQQDLHTLSQLRGQILALEEVVKIKEFLSELTEEEVNNEI